MDHLYNYGISQEDVLSEIRALEITRDDSLLCIASAGEIPLNMTALADIHIVAVDTSESQLRLCRLKQHSACALDPVVAASFLGFMEMDRSVRLRIFREQIRPLLPVEDALFWDAHQEAVGHGVIKSGRFEQYMSKVSALGCLIIGKRNLCRLFECHSVEEQQEIFDRHISGLLVRGIFKAAFHPWIYKDRGIDPAGLTHSGTRNIADFFFQRFRNFCCSTMARQNYYLQYTFFGRILFPDALPEFLQPDHHASFMKNVGNLEYRLSTLEDCLASAPAGRFNKIHISNIGDWMAGEKMQELFGVIENKTLAGSRVVMRYIHYHHRIPGTVPGLKADYSLGEILATTDRYPFYTIVPIVRQ